MDEREKIMRVLEKFAGNNYMNQNQREFLADEIIKLLHPISEDEIREEVKRILFYEFGTYKKDATVEHATDLILSLLHPISEEEIEKIILNTCVQNSAKGIYVVDYENRILHSEILAHALSSRLLGGKCCECKEPRPKDSDLICANCDRKIKPTQSQIVENALITLCNK